ncbi:queuosine precursor transporter [Haloarchaeobius sp. HRN-SO-5]|uniref:queuosine precursor transporter n=1 Tax=Haloarchaeobius sp. HRN-SO-5 TaxID=3446118 RepID=UPI003EC07081
MAHPIRRGDAADAGQVFLIGLFVTALATAQVTASKLLAFSIPISLPHAGEALILPGAALAYAMTFFASDCYSELYGRRAATVMVNVGFAMNFVVLVLVWSTIASPVAAASPVGADTFATVLGASTNIVVGSLLAYVVSQNWDVFAFHWLREATDGEALWLRNVVSTATSQAIDTVIFISVAFLVAPMVLGTGGDLEPPIIFALIVGQYAFKLLVAIADTPFVYAVVAAVESYETGREAAVES